MNKYILTAILIFYHTDLFAEEYTVEEIKLTSHSDQLSGSIVFPKDNNFHSAIVFVHGSGKQTRNLPLAKYFASLGIAALVYDKRGAGKSGGTYEGNQSVSEKNISLLADDAISALRYLRNHPKAKQKLVGLTGISQAGWIVPLAAEKSQAADFLVLWSGPVCTVSEEDIYSRYTADLDSARAPSFNEALKSRKQKYVWPNFLGKDTDPTESLVNLRIPGLWVFGLKDGSIPVDLSIQRLDKLITKGHEYEYAIFSNSGHDNISETFVTVTDWIAKLSRKSR